MGLATFLNSGHPPTTLRGLRFFAFSETAIIQRGTVTSDGGGGGTMTWAAYGTASCRVAALAGSPQLIAGRLDEASTHLVTTPEGTIVSTKDRIVVANRGTLVVTNVADSSDARDVRFEVVLV